MKLIRHETIQGLIATKQTGGDAAIGDVIVFFDCHVNPRAGWEEVFLQTMTRMGDHRTVVVPGITELNADTFEEIPTSPVGKACYVSWQAEFPWLDGLGRDVPIMSGGLLAMTRQWWHETGGYDHYMKAWGGENIDQSLRTWLCGGRIEYAEGSFVGHMYRQAKFKATERKYPIDFTSVTRNKLRAVTGWFGEFANKVETFSEYQNFQKNNNSLLDMSSYKEIQDTLQCAPFTAFLMRFRNIYVDSGYIPEQVHQLREAKTGLCLERRGDKADSYTFVMTSCSVPMSNGIANELQLYHLSNIDLSKADHSCCSGIAHWNSLTCMDSHGIGNLVTPYSCQVLGTSPHQDFKFADNGQIIWGSNVADVSTRGCVAPRVVAVAKKRATQGVSSCTVKVVPAEGSAFVGAMPGRFMLQSMQVDGLCGAAFDDGSNTDLAYVPCNPQDPAQLFDATPSLHGFSLRAGNSNRCLDAAAGTDVVLYWCENANLNQVWNLEQEKLVWKQGANTTCVDSEPIPHEPVYKLMSCASKMGQRLQKSDVAADGSFFLKDADAGLCLAPTKGKDESGFKNLNLGPCKEHNRWLYNPVFSQVQHVASKLCIDSGPEDKPILYPCHQSVQISQNYQFIDQQGWLQTESRCLDRLPTHNLEVVVIPCEESESKGFRWEKVNGFVPLERQIWDRVEKPPADVPRLGDVVF